MDLGIAYLTTAFVLTAQTLSSAASPADFDKIMFKGESAIAYGDDGKPMFQGKREYLLSVAQNPDGHITLYDAERRMVRVSDPKARGIWLSCSELLPMQEACGAVGAAASAGRRPSRGAAVRPEPLGAIPACPGDPRCPRL